MVRTVLTLNTLATRRRNKVKQGDYFVKNPEIVQIFDDLEQYKKFCQIAFGYGHDGYVFNEKDLYNDKSRAWRAFCNFRKGKKRPYFNKFDKRFQGRYHSKRRQ